MQKMKPIQIMNSSDHLLEKSPLSDQKLKILQLLGQGCNTDQIGKAMCISNRTVRYHIERILEKLQAKNRMQAFAIAVKNGWIQI